MKYTEYIDNILNTRGRFSCVGYKERHHIIPKCLGGKNNKENLIDLYPQEHYEAHKLLASEYPDNNKILYAYWCISHMSYSDNHVIEITSEEYAKMKEMLKKARENFEPWNKGKINVYDDETIKKMSESHLGNTAKTGKKLSNETKEKISKAHMGKKLSDEHKEKISQGGKGIKRSEETKEKIRQSKLGKPRSDETKRKLSESHKGKIPWNKGLKGIKK